MENSPKASNSWKSSWNFGTLVKSLTSKSEEVLQAYQRDLQEFGLGIKKETSVAAGLTAHVVKELPVSLENTAAVAQESLEAVGQTIEEFSSSVWRGTADLIGQVKEAVKKVDEEAVASSEPSETATSGRYSRYEAQLNAMQRDSGTYCDEPEDQEDYSAWRSSFDLDARKDEVKTLLEDNAFIQELHERTVPSNIEDGVFWTRYFYRVYKLQQAEDARAELVKRATAMEEEDLSWEVEEEEVKDRTPAPTPIEKPVSPPVARECAGEDEAGSDNSTGSEWSLVVQDEVESPPKIQGKEKTQASSKATDPVKDKDKEEDWGEWE